MSETFAIFAREIVFDNSLCLVVMIVGSTFIIPRLTAWLSTNCTPTIPRQLTAVSCASCASCDGVPGQSALHQLLVVLEILAGLLGEVLLASLLQKPETVQGLLYITFESHIYLSSKNRCSEKSNDIRFSEKSLNKDPM